MKATQRKSALKKVPKFRSDDEARDFWDTHDFTDYFDGSEALEYEYSKEDLAETAIIRAVREVQDSLGDATSREAGELRQMIRLALRQYLRARPKARAKAKKAA